ncbi:DUF447 domain-containing protein [Halobellus rubicundus]|uniref:DUF447 domain-containing protein n=1 Tax=Halobellus rubicundus TaxID=2996466 RepID=A0ABD5MDK5_9EURY
MTESGSDLTAKAEWPLSLRGVTETVVTSRGPNDRWNVAALGVHAPEETGRDGDARDDGDDVPNGGVATATTWGNTRTRKNFDRRGRGVIQFVSDPRTFVEAAVTIREEADPVLPSAHAWAEVEVERIESGESNGTRRERWALYPVESAVRERVVPRLNRGAAAAIEATVAASRLDVPAYDTDELLSRLRYFAETVDRCGGAPEREAFAILDDATDWRERLPDEVDAPRFDA